MRIEFINAFYLRKKKVSPIFWCFR